MRVSRGKSFLFCVSTIFLLVGIMFTMVNTFAKYVKRVTKEDSAVAARFDVEISVPEELESAFDDVPFSIFFTEKEQTKAFTFSVENKSEVSIVCRPFISEDASFEVYVSEKLCESFFVEMGECIDFQIVITTKGLNKHSKAAALVIEISQAEGE